MKDREKRVSAVLEYPCSWKYKVIGANQDGMLQAVAEIVQDRTYRMRLSKSSEKGKYHCFNLEVVVESEGHRMAVYEALRTHPSVTFVL